MLVIDAFHNYNASGNHNYDNNKGKYLIQIDKPTITKTTNKIQKRENDKFFKASAFFKNYKIQLVKKQRLRYKQKRVLLKCRYNEVLFFGTLLHR